MLEQRHGFSVQSDPKSDKKMASNPQRHNNSRSSKTGIVGHRERSRESPRRNLGLSTRAGSSPAGFTSSAPLLLVRSLIRLFIRVADACAYDSAPSRTRCDTALICTAARAFQRPLSSELQIEVPKQAVALATVGAQRRRFWAARGLDRTLCGRRKCLGLSWLDWSISLSCNLRLPFVSLLDRPEIYNRDRRGLQAMQQ